MKNIHKKKIGIITYDYNHLKTEQVVFPICDKGYEIIIYALPFFERPRRKTLFNHRPEQFKGMHPREMSQKIDAEYVVCSNDFEIDDRCDYYLVTGAGILSEKCVSNKKIINCHPGLIPMSRGLDSFKWAIYDYIPVGNTLHFIDHRVDAGEIIHQEITPLFEMDTIADFANRHYEQEIKMLIDFERYVEGCGGNIPELKEGIVHKRMNANIEEEMLNRFENYKSKFSKG